MSKNIEINVLDSNGSYEILYPKTKWNNVEDGQNYVDTQINNINTIIESQSTDWSYWGIFSYRISLSPTTIIASSLLSNYDLLIQLQSITGKIQTKGLSSSGTQWGIYLNNVKFYLSNSPQGEVFNWVDKEYKDINETNLKNWLIISLSSFSSIGYQSYSRPNSEYIINYGPGYITGNTTTAEVSFSSERLYYNVSLVPNSYSVRTSFYRSDLLYSADLTLSCKIYRRKGVPLELLQ